MLISLFLNLLTNEETNPLLVKKINRSLIFIELNLSMMLCYYNKHRKQGYSGLKKETYFD